MRVGLARPRFGTVSAHLAPPRAPEARAEGMRALAAIRAKFKGGDLNDLKAAVEKALNARVKGGGVLWLSYPVPGWKFLDHQSVDVGSDHPAELITFVHVRTRRVVTFLVVNCMSVSTGVLHAKQIMRVSLLLDADVIIASECRDFWGPDIWGADDYHWHQPGKLGSSESGTLIASAKATTWMKRRRVVKLSNRTPEGGGPGIDERSAALALIVMKPLRKVGLK